ncbi:MAG: D-glycero-alpha-D-manno-heptose-1,7-bisphosphate 7-phosphatase [Thermoplasmata archaeon]
MARSTSRPALFIDRDGTVNPDLHYLREAERIEVLRGVGDGLGLAHAHGFVIVCVTNQSGVERGFYTVEEVDRIHARLNERLEKRGGKIDAFYYCPHAPEANCTCRKPGTELFERAVVDLGLDLARSAVIGDRWVDIEAGRRLGLLTAIVPPVGRDAEIERELVEHGATPDLRASSLRNAVLRVLARG